MSNFHQYKNGLQRLWPLPNVNQIAAMNINFVEYIDLQVFDIFQGKQLEMKMFYKNS